MGLRDRALLCGNALALQPLSTGTTMYWCVVRREIATPVWFLDLVPVPQIFLFFFEDTIA